MAKWNRKGRMRRTLMMMWNIENDEDVSESDTDIQGGL